MIKSLLTCLLLLVSLLGTAQLSESANSLLHQELTQRINKLRTAKAMVPLESNTILKKAAKNHSVYLAKTKKLSHDQPDPTFATPSKRVAHFKASEFELVGENIIQSSPVTLPLTEESIIKNAEEMVNAWKNSPGHYANIINQNYKFGGIDFQYDSIKKVIYVTQVFGKKGTRIKGQLSTNAFGLSDNESNCNLEGIASNVVANMGNSVEIEGNKVLFYYHNLTQFNQFFTTSNDGIAIDLIFRNQVRCGASNQIDFSPVYDGILLKPVYRDELLRKNIAKSDYRIITQVGTIPDSLISKDISCSVILIKNGKKCKYLIPGNVPAKQYALKPLKPKLKNPTHVSLQHTGIIATQELSYNFKSNSSIPISYPSLKKMNYPIHSMDITSYSSVEGDVNNNNRLHNQRAESIKQHVQRETGMKHLKTTIEAKENWDKMYFQLRYFMADDLASQSKEELKSLLASENNRLPWDSLLFDQRKSIATVNYQGTVSDDDRKLFWMNFKTAVSEKNYDLANKALYELFTNNENAVAPLFEDAMFKSIMITPALTQNVAAVLTKSYKTDVSKTIEFLFTWLNKGNSLSAESKYNLLHLYTLLSIDLLNNWDLPAKRLANVVHPSIVKKLADKQLEDEELQLNLHLVFLRYYGQINDGINISKSFNYIIDYFNSKPLKIEDDINLVLFLNLWSQYDLTHDHLFYKFKKGILNEEAVFILLKTLNFYAPEGKDINDYEKVYLKALELNKTKWCGWVNSEFQILRNEKIKKLFCDKCDGL